MGLFGRGRDKTLLPAATMGEVVDAHLKNCYEVAANFALANDDEPWSVVHGTIKTEIVKGTGIFTRPLEHGFCVWEEEGIAYEPSTDTVYTLDAFDCLFNPTFDTIHPPTGPDSWRRVCVKYGHYGPWRPDCPPVKPDDDDDDDWADDWDDDPDI